MSAAQLAALQAEAVGFLNAPNPKSTKKSRKRQTHAAKRATSSFRIISKPVTKTSRSKGTPADKKADPKDKTDKADGAAGSPAKKTKSKSPTKGKKGKGKGKGKKAKLERQSTVTLTEKEARAFIAKTEPTRTLTELTANPGVKATK